MYPFYQTFALRKNYHHQIPLKSCCHHNRHLNSNRHPLCTPHPDHLFHPGDSHLNEPYPFHTPHPDHLPHPGNSHPEHPHNHLPGNPHHPHSHHPDSHNYPDHLPVPPGSSGNPLCPGLPPMPSVSWSRSH